MPTQSQLLGLEAERIAGQQTAEQAAIRLKRQANNLRLLVMSNPRATDNTPLFASADQALLARIHANTLTDGDYLTLGREITEHRTFLGAGLEQIQIPGENTTMASLVPESINGIPALVRRSVEENTGDMEFLKGATFGQAFRGFFSLVEKKGLWAALVAVFQTMFGDGNSEEAKELRQEIARVNADDTGAHLRQSMTTAGYSTDIIDETVRGVRNGILQRGGVSPEGGAAPQATLGNTVPEPITQQTRDQISATLENQISDYLGIAARRPPAIAGQPEPPARAIPPLDPAMQVQMNSLIVATRGGFNRENLRNSLVELLTGATADGIPENQVALLIEERIRRDNAIGLNGLNATLRTSIARQIARSHAEGLRGVTTPSQQVPTADALTQEFSPRVEEAVGRMPPALLGVVNRENLTNLITGSAVHLAMDTANPPTRENLQQRMQATILSRMGQDVSTYFNSSTALPTEVKNRLNTPEARSEIAALIAANYMDPASAESQAAMRNVENHMRQGIGESISTRVRDGVTVRINHEIDNTNWNYLLGPLAFAHTLGGQSTRTYAESRGWVPNAAERTMAANTTASAVRRVLTDSNWYTRVNSQRRSLAQLSREELKRALIDEIRSSLQGLSINSLNPYIDAIATGTVNGTPEHPGECVMANLTPQILSLLTNNGASPPPPSPPVPASSPPPPLQQSQNGR